MRKIEIKDLFTSLQSQMQGTLATNSNFIVHPGSEGDSLENAWIELLRTYLPNRYSIDKAMVIDHLGNVSQQIDIVIYDNWYTPFIFNQNGFKYIPAEGVYAVFEVKPDIKGNIKYAGDKIASVRNLLRTSARMINSGKKLDPRPLTKIIGGIIGIKCTQTIRTTKKNLKALQGFNTLDIVCTAEDGCYIVDYEHKNENITTEFKSIQNFYDNRKFKKLISCHKNNSLIMFIMQLTSYLQQSIGTVPAIDMQKYLNNIDVTIDKEI